MENKTLFVPVCVCLLTSTILVACRPFLAPTPVQSTKMPAPLPTNTPMPTPAIETKTYTDEFAGFSIDYPADWVVEGEPGYYAQFTELSAETTEDSAKVARFFTRTQPDMTSLDDFQEDYLSSLNEEWEIGEPDSVTVAGTEGVAMSVKGAFYSDEIESQAHVVLAVNGDLGLSFGSISPADTWEKNWPIFEMMLGSLMFFEAVAMPEPTPEPELTLVGYDYWYRDVGDGWSEAWVGLALENKTDRPADFDKVQLPPPVMETAEGQTYEGAVGYYPRYVLEPYLKESNNIEAARMIPPGFRVLARTITGSDGRQPAYAVFRFAQAAHPTLITFPGTGFTIDLYDAYQTESLGFVGADSSSIKPITELYGRVLVDDPNGAKVTVGGCNIGQRGRTADLEPSLILVIENQDKFQDTSFTLSLPFVSITSDGVYGYSGQFDPLPSYTVGPGQTKEEEFWLSIWGDRWEVEEAYERLTASYFVLYEEIPDKYTVYILTDCTTGQ